jgi:hypothetical protein
MAVALPVPPDHPDLQVQTVAIRPPALAAAGVLDPTVVVGPGPTAADVALTAVTVTAVSLRWNRDRLFSLSS